MPLSVGVNPPKTPVTEGSMDMAPATLPNVCKMPGPPAPFVPTPLPNIGQSRDRLTDATTSVKIEGKKVAIKGAYYMSQPSPDVASQGTGGGIVSAKTQGKTEFVAPGSMNVKAEGKNIQLLGDAMTNNGGSPSNAATMPGNQQPPTAMGVIVLECDPSWDDCQKKQMKAKAAAMDKIA
ncbi:MAG TPA: PAAR-like domain-containing protein, partial [Pseudomonadales bacterium]|nr:PAAR-like domain-containing protein [Pseudomonadales bacterium]